MASLGDGLFLTKTIIFLFGFAFFFFLPHMDACFCGLIIRKPQLLHPYSILGVLSLHSCWINLYGGPVDDSRSDCPFSTFRWYTHLTRLSLVKGQGNAKFLTTWWEKRKKGALVGAGGGGDLLCNFASMVASIYIQMWTLSISLASLQDPQTLQDNQEAKNK
jgi:hypothetical protein